MNGVNLRTTGPGAPFPSSPLRGDTADTPAKGGKPAAGEDSAAAPAKEKAPALTLETVARAIERYIPEALPNTRLKIDHDRKTDLFVYKAVDRDSGEVVRQYPADDILRFIAFYREREGMVVDDLV